MPELPETDVEILRGSELIEYLTTDVVFPAKINNSADYVLFLQGGWLAMGPARGSSFSTIHFYDLDEEFTLSDIRSHISAAIRSRGNRKPALTLEVDFENPIDRSAV